MTVLPPDVTSDLTTWARAFRPVVEQFAVEVTTHVRSEIPAYAGPDGGRRQQAVEKAVAAATHQFLDTIDGLPHRPRHVDQQFQAIGQREALAAGGLSAFHAALRVAAGRAWSVTKALGPAAELTAAARGHLADLLTAYVDHLAHQAERGETAARQISGADVRQARARLADQLLSGQYSAEHETDGSSPWAVPDEVIVAVVEPDDRLADLGALHRAGLVVMRDQQIVVIAAPEARSDLERDVSGARIAFSWPVAPTETAAAHRWAARALELVRHGVIEETPIVDCLQHRTQLWLHSEPLLRQRMCQDLLKPLLAETPNSREILSETLLVWLETRDSAPAIAARLGVHPQTVRYRWKRINEIFGESLHDSEFIVQITMLLKASVPLWKAGDQSDFERFRDEQEAS